MGTLTWNKTPCLAFFFSLKVTVFECIRSGEAARRHQRIPSAARR